MHKTNSGVGRFKSTGFLTILRRFTGNFKSSNSLKTNHLNIMKKLVILLFVLIMVNGCGGHGSRGYGGHGGGHGEGHRH